MPWSLVGGSAFLLMTDPAGGSHIYPATIDAANQITVQWTVIGPVNDWVRAWELTDAAGRKQVSRPQIFSVVSSPS